MNDKKKRNRLFKGILFFIVLDLIITSLILLKHINSDSLLPSQPKMPARLDEFNLQFTDYENLKYFFEPAANTVEKDTPLWLGYTATYSINGDALNERFDYTPGKNPGAFRIITLGASYTFGLYVDTQDNYSEKLEDLLNNNLQCQDYEKFEVINLGFPAYDFVYSSARFNKRGLKYQPDLVLWLIYDDNFYRVNEYLLPIEKGLAGKGVAFFDSEKKIYSQNFQAMEEFRKTYSQDEIMDYQNKALSSVAKNFKGQLRFIHFGNLQENYRKELLKISKDHSNIKVWGGLTNVSDMDEYRLADKHPNKKGHEIIAEELFTYLRENQFKSCLPLN